MKNRTKPSSANDDLTVMFNTGRARVKVSFDRLKAMVEAQFPGIRVETTDDPTDNMEVVSGFVPRANMTEAEIASYRARCNSVAQFTEAALKKIYRYGLVAVITSAYSFVREVGIAIL